MDKAAKEQTPHYRSAMPSTEGQSELPGCCHTEELPCHCWFPENEAGLLNKSGNRPETRRFCTGLLQHSCWNHWSTESCKPSKIPTLLLLKGVQQVQADPMGKPNIATEVAPCFQAREDRDPLCWPFQYPARHGLMTTQLYTNKGLPGKVSSS